MEHPGCRTSRLLALPWGRLEIFARGARVPAPLQPTAAALELLDGRHLPTFATFRRQPPAPYAAVWPTRRPLPDFRHSADLTLDDVAGVVLAEIHTLTCQTCGAHLRAVYPGGGIPSFSENLSEHRLINECPTCGTGFAHSRIQALAIVP
ncbi:hypothetical protein NN3_29350 [Nocardia neocaledoniensis NBRC 108232]|nr:hypothetical protein NN3_29350 [Nocardia neocaledoniensis NBRC 108232]